MWPWTGKLELIPVPVTDVDRAKAFSVDQVGFHADVDHQVTDALRFGQLTPSGSACSIAMGNGVAASEIDVQPWGSFVTCGDPDGNTWSLQQLPPPT